MFYQKIIFFATNFICNHCCRPMISLMDNRSAETNSSLFSIFDSWIERMESLRGSFADSQYGTFVIILYFVTTIIFLHKLLSPFSKTKSTCNILSSNKLGLTLFIVGGLHSIYIYHNVNKFSDIECSYVYSAFLQIFTLFSIYIVLPYIIWELVSIIKRESTGGEDEHLWKGTIFQEKIKLILLALYVCNLGCTMYNHSLKYTTTQIVEINTKLEI